MCITYDNILLFIMCNFLMKLWGEGVCLVLIILIYQYHVKNVALAQILCHIQYILYMYIVSWPREPRCLF